MMLKWVDRIFNLTKGLGGADHDLMGELKDLAVKDQGSLQLKAGTIIQKKFKYYGDQSQLLSIFANIPLVV